LAKRKIKKKQDPEKLKEFLLNQGKIFAKELKEKATEWEKILYKILKDLNYKFKFQVPVVVPVGKSYKLYILDFLLTDSNLVIEADGKFHNNPENRKKDNLRTKHLQKQGFYILRLSNKQIISFDKSQISEIIKTRILLTKQNLL